jgi:hypothetical protein
MFLINLKENNILIIEKKIFTYKDVKNENIL